MIKKSLPIILGVVIGFGFSYIPNNFMSKKYENIAFFIVVGIVIIGALWNYFSVKKREENG